MSEADDFFGRANRLLERWDNEVGSLPN